MIGPLHEFQDTVDCRRVGKGSEIAGAVAADAAGHEDARIIFLDSDLDIRIGLVVAEHDIVMGMVFLDERIFQDEGFHFRGDDDGFQIGGMTDHGRYFRRPVGIVADVTGHAVAQVDGFADVNDLALFILPEIDAGLGRQVADFFPDGLADGHGLYPLLAGHEGLGPFQDGLEELTRIGFRYLADFFGRPHGDDRTAAGTAFGTEVDEVVCRLDDV